MSFHLNQLRDLLEVRTIAELYTKAKAVVHELEFEHFIYGVRLHMGGGEAHEFVLSGYPSSWRSLYEQHGYAAIDPTVAHCLSSTLPIVWSDALFVDHGAAALMEHAHQYGLRSGLTVPMHSSTLQTGLLSMASEAASLDNDVERIAHSQLFATYLHEAARKLVQKNARVHQTCCHLTPREEECLSWAAAGKSSWEISQIVASSERTVNFHIGNVIQKLQVASRSHAIANALARGLIQI
jgi:DNA-binding CsgD family transcriptional regulator